MTDISLSTVVFDGHPVETALDETAALGLRFVEPAYIKGYMDFNETAFSEEAARTLRKLLDHSGLSVRAISAHIDLGAPEAKEMLARRLRFAASIGAGIVITNAATRADLAKMERSLAAVLPEAEASGVTIALENPGHGRDAAIANGASGAAVVAKFGSDRVRLNYDCANALTYSEGQLRPIDDIDRALPVLAHVHFKDTRRIADGWTYVPAGDGEVGLKELALKLAPSRVPLGLELPLRLSRPAGRDPERRRPPLDLAAIRAAVRTSHQRAVEWLSPIMTARSQGP